MKINLKNGKVIECDRENETIYCNAIALKEINYGGSIETIPGKVQLTDINGENIIINIDDVKGTEK